MNALRTLRPARLLACVLALGMVGCAALQTPDVQVAEVPPGNRAWRADVPVAATPGAIFPGDAYRPLFENVRARAVGDSLTIQIQENTTARQSSKMSVNREGKVDATIGALPFAPSATLGRAKVGASSSNDASAAGESGSDNVFTGTITATVAEVLPNGNLLVVGEKQVGVNQTIDSLRFSGVVDPRFIRPGNTIVSTQLADVRVQFRGKGDIERAQKVGWLQRFFFSYLPL